MTLCGLALMMWMAALSHFVVDQYFFNGRCPFVAKDMVAPSTSLRDDEKLISLSFCSNVSSMLLLLQPVDDFKELLTSLKLQIFTCLYGFYKLRHENGTEVGKAHIGVDFFSWLIWWTYFSSMPGAFYGFLVSRLFLLIFSASCKGRWWVRM